MTRRPYQEDVLSAFIKEPDRCWALLWERQSGKSTTLADFALYEMLRHPGRTVIYASASLLLAQEITLKTATRANQSLQQLIEEDAARLKQFADHAQSLLDAQTQAASGTAAHWLNQYSTAHQLKVIDRYQGMVNDLNSDDWPLHGNTSGLSPFLRSPSRLEFKTFDTLNDREVKQNDLADFTNLFRQQRLEFRVYHSPTCYSRTKVIAPNIATARSWSGTVLLDEVAFIRNLRELMTALLPVISTDKHFKLILSTTPPEFDDTHYSFELLAPPAGIQFTPRAEGNWYMSESGIPVHRADAFDTALAGKKIFDLKTGQEITPAEAFQRAPNKDGHRIAHWLTWMAGGSAACDMLRLRTAQERGINQSQNFQINSDEEMIVGLNWLYQNLGGHASSPGSARASRAVSGASPETHSSLVTRHSSLPIGLGFDVATTTKGKSNPSVVSIMEEHGPEWLVRCRFIWKTHDPQIANQRLQAILNVLERRGVRPRALAQDATNERYYAEQNRTYFRARVPVILVVASEAVNKPGLDKPTNWKEYLSNQLVAKLDDNNLTLPPDDYTRVDYRLVMKDRGRFVCEPNDQGMHGDCFDADKLAGHALSAINSRRTIVPPREWWPKPSPPPRLGGYG